MKEQWTRIRKARRVENVLINIIMKENIKNKDFIKDLEVIKEFQLEEIKGGVTDQLSEEKCASCCQLALGGGSASREVD
ncbi:hypothetical protein C0T31_04715 [Dysgonamonadaceae bacterium]|jgi:hypothetical protein|nr:hypothetical protein C0T31_04715 [Dysgonamonadaceae bacterium]